MIILLKLCHCFEEKVAAYVTAQVLLNPCLCLPRALGPSFLPPILSETFSWIDHCDIFWLTFGKNISYLVPFCSLLLPFFFFGYWLNLKHECKLRLWNSDYSDSYSCFLLFINENTKWKISSYEFRGLIILL